jgi:lipopolysaccharide heptosyltransferase I
VITPTPRRILLIRPSALGDVCRSVPVLVSLKRAFPEATVDWMVQDSFVEAIESHPDLGQVVPFPRKQLGRFMRTGRIDRVLGWMRSVRRNNYDLVVDAQGLLRSGLIARAAGAGVRVGYANAQEGAGFLYNRRFRVGRDLHAVDRMLALIEAAGIEPIADMRLYTSEAARSEAEALCPEPAVVIAPTSRWAAKRWPIDRFADLTARLLDAGTGPIAIVGGPGEEEQCKPLLDRFADEPRVINLVGRTRIGVLMAVIERARVVVANDSAALHMAAGFGRPTVALFGPTEVARVGPYQREADVIQHLQPGDTLDHKTAANVRLMERIGVEEVVDMVIQRLSSD